MLQLDKIEIVSIAQPIENALLALVHFGATMGSGQLQAHAGMAQNANLSCALALLADIHDGATEDTVMAQA